MSKMGLHTTNEAGEFNRVRLVYPIRTQNMEGSYVDAGGCNKCEIPESQRQDLCSLGSCVKQELKDSEAERRIAD